MKKDKYQLILWSAIIVYFIVFAVLSCLRHYGFQTQTWDMGAFVQTFYNSIHGHLLANNLEEAPNHLGVHMSPWLLVLVPFYKILPSPYTPLVLQTIALAIAAWPLYLLALEILQNKKIALLIAISYLFYPSVHWINLFDFHAIAFFVPLMLTAFYFIEKEKWLWASLFLILSASTKENAILVVALAGLYLFLFKIKKEENSAKWFDKQKKIGLLVLVLAIIYFFVSVKIIMPAFGGGLLRLDRYGDLGANPTEIIQNIIRHPLLLAQTVFTPAKIFYVLWLLFPLLFLPLLAWRSWPIIVVGLAQNLLTSFKFQTSSFYQYDSIIIPGLFIGLIYGCKKILDKYPDKDKTFSVAFMTAMLVTFVLRSPVNPLNFPSYLFAYTDQAQAYEQIVAHTPPAVSVTAPTHLVPHLADRETVYMMGAEKSTTDIVIIDLENKFPFTDAEEFRQYIQNYIDSGLYHAAVKDDRYIYLYQTSLAPLDLGEGFVER